MYYVYMSQCTDRWPALVKTIMNLGDLRHKQNFVIGFGRTVLRGVGGLIIVTDRTARKNSNALHLHSKGIRLESQ